MSLIGTLLRREKYSEDQPRDEQGRFAGDGGGSGSLSTNQQDAIDGYVGGMTYDSVNAYLRDPAGYEKEPDQYSPDPLSIEDTKQQIALLTEAISGNELEKDTVLYRGTDAREKGYQRGVTFTDQGFGSTSEDPAMAEKFANGVLYEIHAPAGTEGLKVSAHETLLQRGTSYRIMGSHTERGLRKIVLNVVSQHPRALKTVDEFTPFEELLDDKEFWAEFQQALMETMPERMLNIYMAGADAALRVKPRKTKEWDPDQPRDEQGRWEGDGGGGGRGSAAWTDQQLEKDIAQSERVIGYTMEREALNQRQQEARQWYTGTGYQTINGSLRSGDGPSSDEVKQNIKELDQAISENTIDEPIAVFRGLKEDLNLSEGDSFVDHGFVSVSTDPDNAADYSKTFNGRVGCVMKIELPAGTGVLSGEPMETILARDLKFTVTSVSEANLINTPSGLLPVRAYTLRISR